MYKRKDPIYVQEKRHNLRTREKTQSTYKRKDTIYVQEERNNLPTREKTQSRYKRKDTIYVHEETHNLRTRGKTQSTYKRKLLKQDYVALWLKSSVQKFKGRLLRNINFPSGNGSIPLYVDVFFPRSPTRILLALTI